MDKNKLMYEMAKQKVSMETLNKSPSAEQRIFFPSCAVLKAGNTQSIPPLLIPSSGEKSHAVSSRRFIQSFPILDMCHKLNMSRSAFYRKCNGISEFTQGEIQKIVDILNLDSPVGIFFAEKVS